MISIELDKSPSFSSNAVAPGSVKFVFLKISIVVSPINVITGGILSTWTGSSSWFGSDTSPSELEQDEIN